METDEPQIGDRMLVEDYDDFDGTDYRSGPSSSPGSELSNTIHQTIEGTDESSSTSSSDADQGSPDAKSSPRLRKRGSNERPSAGRSAKRRKVSKNTPKSHRALDAYRNLLNEYINEVNNPYGQDGGEDDDRTWSEKHPTEYRNVATVGLSEWTATDRDRFFEALSRHGRHDLPALSAAVGTKSLPQVRQYVMALQRQADNNELKGRRDRMFEGLQVMPAAVQLGRSCERALDDVAQRLRDKDEKFERRKQEDVWEEWGNLSRKAALAAEGAVDVLDNRHEERLVVKSEKQDATLGAAGTTDQDRKSDASEDDTLPPSDFTFLRPVPLYAAPLQRLKPALYLLNTPELLDLSMTVFMNQHPGRAVPTQERFTNAENNWHTMANNYPLQQPSITATCLLDLLNLVIILTKRLMSTAHHIALSRLRATDTKTHHRRRAGRNGAIAVQRGDVTTACKILGLKTRRQAQEWWQKAARRNRLRIVDTFSRRHRTGFLRATGGGKRMRYSEVERALLVHEESDEDGDVANGASNDENLEDSSQDMSGTEEYYSFSSSSPPLDLHDDLGEGHLSDASSVNWTTSSSSRSPSPSQVHSSNRSEHTSFINGSPPGTNPTRPALLSPDMAAYKLETAYLLHQDALATRAEEARLFTLLRLPPPASHDIKLEEPVDANGKPVVPPPRERRRPEDLRRWDDGLLDVNDGYASEWEAFVGRIPEHAFDETMKEWIRARARARKRMRERDEVGSGGGKHHRRTGTEEVVPIARADQVLQTESAQNGDREISGRQDESEKGYVDDDSEHGSISDGDEDSSTDEDSEDSAESNDEADADDIAEEAVLVGGQDMGSENGSIHDTSVSSQKPGVADDMPAAPALTDTEAIEGVTARDQTGRRPQRERGTTTSYSIAPANAEDVLLPDYLAQRIGRLDAEGESEDDWVDAESEPEL